MMALLQIEDGRRVSIKSVNAVKGTFMKIQPHESDFIQLPNPKAILEM
jgi:ubiquitin fusion degradation protein 1